MALDSGTVATSGTARAIGSTHSRRWNRVGWGRTPSRNRAKGDFRSPGARARPERGKHSGFRASKRRSSSSYLTAPAKITESCSKSGETTTLLMPFFGTAKSYFPVFARPGAISIALFRTADNWLRVKFWEYCELVADAYQNSPAMGFTCSLILGARARRCPCWPHEVYRLIRPDRAGRRRVDYSVTALSRFMPSAPHGFGRKQD